MAYQHQASSLLFQFLYAASVFACIFEIKKLPNYLTVNFDLIFCSILDTWEEKCELQVAAKHHASTFGLGSDKVIGLAVVPLATVVKEANVTLALSHTLPCSDQGQALLNVLSVRNNDEHAKDFVVLKRQKRDSKDQETA